jgi:hypothetical protein
VSHEKAPPNPRIPAHEPGDAVASTRDPLLHELLIHPGGAVRLAAALIGRPDVDQQRVIALGLARRGPLAPRVVPASRDPEHAAEAPEPELGPVSRDEVELHFWSSAK